VFWAADQAKRLGVQAISAIELGVAGGNGLLALESIAQEIADYAGISIRVLGFDTGEGMPEASDYRDLPHVWAQGFYRMDHAALRARLKPTTDLVIGDVKLTIHQMLTQQTIPPIGFVAFDLDYYSSTRDALAMFSYPASTRLPRSYCYFDDVVWPEIACHNEYVGELCAIREFNEMHLDRKLCLVHMLRHMRVHQEGWNEQMYVLHDFQHPLYCVNLTPLGEEYRQS
jgi:hypothetical protein